MENKRSRAAGAAAKRNRQTHRDLAIEALSKRVNRLESALDKNTGIFSDAVKVLEIKLNVFEEVLSMLHRDGAGLVQTDDRRVDFGYYLKRYLDELGAKEEKASAPAETVIVTPDEDAPTIFGG